MAERDKEYASCMAMLPTGGIAACGFLIDVGYRVDYAAMHMERKCRWFCFSEVAVDAKTQN